MSIWNKKEPKDKTVISENKPQSKITKFRRPFHINIGIVIFLLLFVYLVLCLWGYFTSEHIAAYEVRTGRLSENNYYTGIALRKERVIKAPEAGYVNYFVREGEKAGATSILYSIDQSGNLLSSLAAMKNESMDAEALSLVRSACVAFRNSFQNDNFQNTYSFKVEMESMMMELQGTKDLANLQAMDENIRYQTYHAPTPGVVVYNIDKMEKLTPETITPEAFDRTSYKKRIKQTNSYVKKDKAIGKLITSENWSIVIPLTVEKAQEFQAIINEYGTNNSKYIKVKFIKDDSTLNAKMTLLNSNNAWFANLEMNSSMVRFATDRFIDIELILDAEDGLKLPSSAITEQEFYLIPKDYETRGGNHNNTGFLVESIDSEGQPTTVFQSPSIYNESDEYYYVHTNDFAIGTNILKPDSTEKYRIAQTETLKGVYNINKGYCVFRRVNILFENIEYVIIEQGSSYGISQYDRIVLNASLAEEGDIVY